jgi:hypothetical protein
VNVPPPTVFQQALGAAFFRLPEPLRRLHGVRGRARYAGVADVERGRGALARFCARVAGLPPAGDAQRLVVDFTADARTETWQRDFGGRRMATRVVLRDGLLRERLGPVHFRYRLHTNDGAIWWTVAAARLFGLLPLPAALFDRVRCREHVHGDRYRFEVDAALPLAGRVVRYTGWLLPAAGPGDDAAATAASPILDGPVPGSAHDQRD